ncbi:MAG: aldo/keto reductase [Defluviitaleaceae bacterium]|nr:aldo/keto reductase [Defluviitaleaceae bacterium]
MHYNKFKGIELSHLAMGCMRFPQKGEGWGMPIIHDEAQEVIDHCMANGINYYDTAYVYHHGESETFLGEAMKKYPRESFYYADKYTMNAEPDYKKQFATQLERLQTDYIDFYLLHAVGDNTIDRYITNGCIEYFLELKAQGKIKYLGFSFHGSPDALRKMTARHDWDFAMIQLNYFDFWHCGHDDFYHHLQEKNIPIMIMEPVHGGLLANLTDEGNALLKAARPDKSIASWAMRFFFDLPGIATILSGMSNMEQTEDNLATFSENEPLSDEEKEILKKASTLLYESIAAKCTACKYCLDNCPANLDIPYLLTTYNNYKTGGGAWRLNRLLALPESERPEACVHCHICVNDCPQNLDIPSLMKEMEEILAKVQK